MNTKDKKKNEMPEKNCIVISDQSVIAVKRNGVVQQCAYTDTNGAVCTGEFCELSVYGSRPATHTQIVEECAPLLMMFPDTKESFFLLLHKHIEDSKMSAKRLHEAVNRLITHHKYRSFNVADIIGYDKTITVASNVITLRYVTNNQYLRYDDIVVIRGRVDGNECKMFGVKYEVENSPYKSRIIGTWNSGTHAWDIIGQVNDITIAQRQQAFKRSLFKFCNCPPRYNGKYDAELVGKFYEHYSQVVGFGDTLLFEQMLSWDTASALKAWHRTTGEDIIRQGKSSLNAKAEDVEEITNEDALRNKLTLQVIAENMSIYQRMSPQAAERKMQELIDKKLEENGITTKS